MSNYNPKSLRAEEFISHDEILATMAWAQENKNNRPLIESIIDKAAECGGLSHQIGKSTRLNSSHAT